MKTLVICFGMSLMLKANSANFPSRLLWNLVALLADILVLSLVVKQVIAAVLPRARDAITERPLNCVSPSHGATTGKTRKPLKYPKILPTPITLLAYALAWTCWETGTESIIKARIPAWTGCIETLRAHIHIVARIWAGTFALFLSVAGSLFCVRKDMVSSLLGSASVQIIVDRVPKTMKGLRRPHE